MRNSIDVIIPHFMYILYRIEREVFGGLIVLVSRPLSFILI